MNFLLRDPSIGCEKQGGTAQSPIESSTKPRRVLPCEPATLRSVPPRDRYRTIRKQPEPMLSRHEMRCLAVSVVVVVSLLGAMIVTWIATRPEPVAPLSDPLAESRRARIAELDWYGPPSAPLEGLAYVKGQDVYFRSCVACHSADGRGVQGLGKDLLHSRFARMQGDRELVGFIRKGRAANDPDNTTKVAMPPDGGNVDMTDADRANLVVFLRGLSDPRRVPTNLPALPEEDAVASVSHSPPQRTPALTAATAANEPATFRREYDASPSDSGATNSFDPVALARAKKVYASCIACHGKDGLGVKGAGKDLVHSEFFAKSGDAELVAFVKKGRAPDDPANTTGIAMPPKGGNPALSDAKIADAILYIRSLRQQAAAN